MKFNVYSVTEGILLLIFSRCSLYVWLIDGQPFRNTQKKCLINSVCFLVQIDKEKRDTWKLQSKSKRWKVKCMAHENDMKITVLVCWWQNKHTYGIAQLVCIYTLLHFSRSWRDKLIVLWTLKRQAKIFLCICTFHISHF